MTPEEKQLLQEILYRLNRIERSDHYQFEKPLWGGPSGLWIGPSSGKIGFYNTTPVVQPSSNGHTSNMTTVGGTTVTESNGFQGNNSGTYYTIGDLVKHLKALGLIAN